jgi:starch synthase
MNMLEQKRLKVLFLASEADPLVKVGGLGDVAGSLPAAIRQLDPTQILPGQSVSIDIRLAIPYHKVIHLDPNTVEHVAEYSIYQSSRRLPAKAFLTQPDSLPIYLISGSPIAPEAPVYSDDLEFDALKYVFFSIAALELARVIKWQPHIIHANDWHTAAAVYSLALNRPTDAFYHNTVSILGIHNLPYLGVGSSAALGAYGLPPTYDFHLPAWAHHLALPLGLLTADQIVAVSPGYAHEILTPEFGAGLHTFLRTRVNSISGILNGLDNQRWDPSKDDAILQIRSGEFRDSYKKQAGLATSIWI